MSSTADLTMGNTSTQQGLQQGTGIASPDTLPNGATQLAGYSFYELYYPWIWVVCGLLCTFVITALILWLKRRRNTVTACEPNIEIVFHRLSATAPLKDHSHEERLAYFFELNHLVRAMIEEATGIAATDQTTQELKLSLGCIKQIHNLELDKISKFFERCDLIKFAESPSDYTEAKESHEKACSWAKVLIEHSRLPTSDEASMKIEMTQPTQTQSG